MKSIACVLVLTMTAMSLPAMGEDVASTAPAVVTVPADAAAEVVLSSADATLGDAIPTAALDASVVVASGAQLVDDDDDDDRAYMLLYALIALGAFNTAYQSTTAEH